MVPDLNALSDASSNALSNSSGQPLLLTVILDQSSQAHFQRLRDQYFPPARNIVPAHVSLFHNLPEGERRQIVSDLNIAASIDAFDLEVTGLRFMGGGVMYKLESAVLDKVRQSLAERWDDWLIPQDRQKFNAHVVVQNKVKAEEARRTFQILEEEFEPFTARALGLELWTYLGGPWRSEQRFLFL